MGISSNKPFNRQCNVRKGGGPVYSKFCPPKDRVNNSNKVTPKNTKNPCFGPYDNIVQYVFEIDTTGNHITYVDCDYVE